VACNKLFSDGSHPFTLLTPANLAGLFKTPYPVGVLYQHNRFGEDEAVGSCISVEGDGRTFHFIHPDLPFPQDLPEGASGMFRVTVDSDDEGNEWIDLIHVETEDAMPASFDWKGLVLRPIQTKAVSVTMIERMFDVLTSQRGVCANGINACRHPHRGLSMRGAVLFRRRDSIDTVICVDCAKKIIAEPVGDSKPYAQLLLRGSDVHFGAYVEVLDRVITNE